MSLEKTVKNIFETVSGVASALAGEPYVAGQVAAEHVVNTTLYNNKHGQ